MGRHPVNADAIPRELRERPQWVVWRTERRDGKPTKVPYGVKAGRRASVDDPASWCSFGAALKFAERFDVALGYVFHADDPFAGLDLDRCMNGAREPLPAARGNPPAAQQLRRALAKQDRRAHHRPGQAERRPPPDRREHRGEATSRPTTELGSSQSPVGGYTVRASSRANASSTRWLRSCYPSGSRGRIPA